MNDGDGDNTASTLENAFRSSTFPKKDVAQVETGCKAVLTLDMAGSKHVSNQLSLAMPHDEVGRDP